MQTLTIEITHKKGIAALEDLAEKNFIRIMEPSASSFALPGEPASIKEFKQWINQAEENNTITLKDAKSKWASRKKQLLLLTK